MDVHTAKFGATVELRKYLAGIQQALVVEGAFQALLIIELDGPEPECNHLLDRVSAIAKACGATTLRASNSEALYVSKKNAVKRSPAISSTSFFKMCVSVCECCASRRVSR